MSPFRTFAATATINHSSAFKVNCGRQPGRWRSYIFTVAADSTLPISSTAVVSDRTAIL